MTRKRFTDAVASKDSHIITLRIALGLCVAAMFLLWMGWRSAPRQLTVHIPPDMRQTSVQNAGAVPTANVYTFASYIFQQLQYWREDGDADYPNNIYRLQAFLTPDYQAYLTADFERRHGKGETRGRRRSIAELPGAGFTPDRVHIESDGSWIVWFDSEIREYAEGMHVKTAYVRWPLRVVRYDFNRELNPWGLALDGYPKGYFPEKLNLKLAETASRNASNGGRQ